MTLGERLRSIRKDRDYTLEYIADRAGISIPYLSDIERDKALPPLDTLERIAAAFGTNVNMVLSSVDAYNGAYKTSDTLARRNQIASLIGTLPIQHEYAASLIYLMDAAILANTMPDGKTRIK